jgi:hypothetical protein
MVETASGAKMQELARTMVGAQRMVEPLVQMQKMVETASGAKMQELARTVLDLHGLAIPTPLDTQRVAEVARSLLATMAASAEAAMDEGAVRPAGAVSGRTPLFPGLANPWQQVRNWDLAQWIALILTVVTIMLAVAQLRPSGGLTPQEVEQIIRSVQEHATTSSVTPPSTTKPSTSTVAPCTTKPSHPKPST